MRRNYLGKGRKQPVILAEPQVLRQWDDVAKKYTDTITGYKYTFTFDGVEDAPSRYLQTNRTLSNGTGSRKP